MKKYPNPMFKQGTIRDLKGMPLKSIKPWHYRKIKIVCPHCQKEFKHRVREESGQMSILKSATTFALGAVLANKFGPVGLAMAGPITKANNKIVESTVIGKVKNKKRK